MADDLQLVYVLRRRIDRLEQKLKCLTCENVQSNIEANKRTVARVSRIEGRITRLKGIHNDQIYRVYSGFTKRPQTAPVVTRDRSMKITQLEIGDSMTTLKMTPIWFKLDDRNAALKDIIYPTDGTDRDLINTIARYRTMINKSKDFRHEPLKVNQNSIETVIIGLDAFARQYGGELSFTNDELSFTNGAENTACGVANLGSVHLLAASWILTAKFSIKLNLHYHRDLAGSKATMKNFIWDFQKELTHLLQCKSDFIRIFSIEKLEHRKGLIRIHFGITTPERNQTESLARHLRSLLRRLDFRDRKILRLIEKDLERYELIPILSYLQISTNDFDVDQNENYTSNDRSRGRTCGNHPYHLPIGWFYHALHVFNKYSDGNTWLDRRNMDGEWPIAFHGTSSRANERDVGAGSGLFVTTHCNGGADAFTTPFTVSNGDHDETFRLAFQCHVRPDSFTTDTDIVQVGEAWKIIDPRAIRPDGLLLKNETSLF